MQKLDGKDFELIEAAQKAIAANYDGVHFNHTVGAAVRCGSGKIYTGVNVYSRSRPGSCCLSPIRLKHS